MTSALLLRFDDPDLRDGVRMLERLGGVTLVHPLTAWAEQAEGGDRGSPAFAGALEWSVPDATPAAGSPPTLWRCSARPAPPRTWP